MNRFILSFLVLLLVFPCCCCNGNVGRRIYVSSSSGNDNNSGTSLSKPVKSISMALRKGDSVLLKKGDVFYECVNAEGKYVGSYGKGVKPVVCGLKRLESPQWEWIGDSLWRLCLTNEALFSGYRINGSSLLNNIGCIYDYDKNEIHGRRVQYKKNLCDDWDFWQTEHHGLEVTNSHDFDTIYVKLGDNPNRLDLAFSVGQAAFVVTKSSIENISIKGWGFGISAGTDVNVRNCEIDIIGGIMAQSNHEFVSYGNGVEFYVSRNIEKCLVENCVITRCYDSGVTIQGSGGGTATPRNIIVKNNFIEGCCQGWEDFLRNDSHVVYENCVFENNIVVNSGKTSGFNYPDSRFKYCHVLGNNTEGDKGMILRTNTFVGGNYYCSGSYNGKYKSNIWQGNICVIKRGDFLLGNYMGTKDVIRVPVIKGDFGTLKEATEDAISKYRELTGDMTTKFIIKDEKTINKQITKLRKRFLKK